MKVVHVNTEKILERAKELLTAQEVVMPPRREPKQTQSESEDGDAL